MKEEIKKPYVSPRITRVALRKEQAILSQCSETATLPPDGAQICVTFGASKSDVGLGDDAGAPS